MVRNRREDQSLFAADLAKLTGGLEQVEAAQADILLQLALHPSDGTTSQQDQQPAGGSGGVGSGQPLRCFLQHLIDRNHGAMRHIPPPGLSDQTTLVSAVFALLRLMNEQVGAAPGLRRPACSLGVRACVCAWCLASPATCRACCLAWPGLAGHLSAPSSLQQHALVVNAMLMC